MLPSEARFQRPRQAAEFITATVQNILMIYSLKCNACPEDGAIQKLMGSLNPLESRSEITHSLDFCSDGGAGLKVRVHRSGSSSQEHEGCQHTLRHNKMFGGCISVNDFVILPSFRYSFGDISNRR